MVFLTRLPIPGLHRTHSLSGCVIWFPIIGATLGIIASMIGLLAFQFGLSPGIAALLALVTAVCCTGALHEDGLSDFFDAMTAGADRSRRLAIMRESQIGAYGAIALVLSLLARWLMLTQLASTSQMLLVTGLVVSASLSRLAPLCLIYSLPPARADGLSADIGQVELRIFAISASIGLAISLIMAGWLATGLAVALFALPVLWIIDRARTTLRGHTGDVLGAAQQLAEIAVLLALCMAL